jgi:hypothetical protein
MKATKLDVRQVEQDLAKELQRQRVERERQRHDVEKICEDSDEIKELKEKIRLAYLNKERSAQLAEQQFRRQREVVSELRDGEG